MSYMSHKLANILPPATLQPIYVVGVATDIFGIDCKKQLQTYFVTPNALIINCLGVFVNILISILCVNNVVKT